MGDTIRIVLADDHALVRAGMWALLSTEPGIILQGEASRERETYIICREHAPDILVFNLRVSGSGTVDMVRQIRCDSPNIRIVAIVPPELLYVHDLIILGIEGCMLESEVEHKLIRAIQTVMRGDIWISATLIKDLFCRHFRRVYTGQSGILTEREKGVMRLIIEGKTNQEVALELGISQKTVEKRLSDIFSKLNVTTRVAAAVRVVKEDLV